MGIDGGCIGERGFSCDVANACVEELVYMDVEKIFGETVQVFSDLHGVEVMND